MEGGERGRGRGREGEKRHIKIGKLKHLQLKNAIASKNEHSCLKIRG